jgi:hypothetical protein
LWNSFEFFADKSISIPFTEKAIVSPLPQLEFRRYRRRVRQLFGAPFHVEAFQRGLLAGGSGPLAGPPGCTER